MSAQGRGPFVLIGRWLNLDFLLSAMVAGVGDDAVKFGRTNEVWKFYEGLILTISDMKRMKI